jgi:uncharacterized protein YwbE
VGQTSPSFTQHMDVQALELTHRLDAIREKETVTGKELEAMKDQLTHSVTHAHGLEQQLRQARHFASLC